MNRFITAAVLVFLTVSSAFAQQIPSETWMGVYFGGSKIGHANFIVDKAEYKGHPGYRVKSIMNTRMVVLGVGVEQKLDTTVHLNTRFRPVHQLFKMSSGGRTTTVTAEFGVTEILAEFQSPGAKTKTRIRIPPGSKLIGDSTFLTTGTKPKVGDRYEFKMFNPLTITLDDVHSEVAGREELVIGGEVFDAFMIISKTPMGNMVSWQTEEGDLLKAVGLMGVTLIREPKEIALSDKSVEGTYVPPSDLAVVTSAKTATSIPNPNDVRYLKVRLSGLTEKSFAISDHRQKIGSLEEDEKIVAEYEVTAKQFNKAESATLPIPPEGMTEFLQGSAYIEPENPEIVKIARKVAGKEKNAYAVVSSLRSWVNKSVKPRGDMGIVRPSADVLVTRSGVCRDYAVLYSALARAAGVPTKLVAGLIYWNGGFYYHAWAESFVGEWVPVDATLPTDFVDATHIKLAEGDATVMFGIAKTVGTIEAEIIEFK